LDEQFIPIQQILNNKVKMNNDYPEQAGNFRVYNKKNGLKTSVLITTELKVIWLQPMTMFCHYKTIESIHHYLKLYKLN
jgi:hypothetical protein